MKIMYFIILCCFVPRLTQGQLPNCDLKKQADGISVYTCKTEKEKFKTLKAEFVLKNITMEELENFLRQAEHYPTWQYNMIESKIIQPTSGHQISYRAEINAPWPVENREMFLTLTITRDEVNQRMHVETKNIESSIPIKKGTVRIPFMHGSWTVTKDKNDLQVKYILQVDPGGSLPAWLVNLAMAEGPYTTFRNLKKQIEK